jgi:short-subunit dehydrogenase
MALPTAAEDSTALITGASSGIGAEIARELAARGHGVALVARREERLRELAAELSERHGVRAEAIRADLGRESDRDELAARLTEGGLRVGVLVNNAGFGDHADFADADRKRMTRMIELNCVALTDLQGRYLPPMVERGEGAVINVASTAAFQPLPSNAVYAATKAFVLSLSEAVHNELRGSGVTVTALCPGPVSTEFVEEAGFGGAEERTPGLIWMSAPDVARAAVGGAEKGKRVVVPGALNRATALGGQHSPRSVLLPLVRRAHQLKRHRSQRHERGSEERDHAVRREREAAASRRGAQASRTDLPREVGVKCEPVEQRLPHPALVAPEPRERDGAEVSPGPLGEERQRSRSEEQPPGALVDRGPALAADGGLPAGAIGRDQRAVLPLPAERLRLRLEVHRRGAGLDRNPTALAALEHAGASGCLDLDRSAHRGARRRVGECQPAIERRAAERTTQAGITS